jgi:hypothetical protein
VKKASPAWNVEYLYNLAGKEVAVFSSGTGQWLRSECTRVAATWARMPSGRAQLPTLAKGLFTVWTQSPKTFVVTNNRYKGKAAVDATEIKALLSGTKVAAPEPLKQRYTEELSSIAA